MTVDVRYAVVGAGNRGRGAAWIRGHPGAELVAVADPDPARRQAAAGSEDPLGPAAHQQCLTQLLVPQLHRTHLGRQPTGELVLVTNAELTKAVHRTDLLAVILRRSVDSPGGCSVRASRRPASRDGGVWIGWQASDR